AGACHADRAGVSPSPPPYAPPSLLSRERGGGAALSDKSSHLAAPLNPSSRHSRAFTPNRPLQPPCHLPAQLHPAVAAWIMGAHIGWSPTPEQVKVAFHLYCKLPFGRLHQNAPEVVALGKLIWRSPSAVAMQLVNLASLGPAIIASGRKGLSSASK